MLRSKSSSSRARAASTSSRGLSSSRGRGRGASGSSSTTSSPNSSNPFEKERIENAAKREQRGQESAAANSRGGRGSSRGGFQNKTVRFTSPPIQQPKVPSTVDISPSVLTNGASLTSTNSTSVSNAGLPTSQAPFNPFAPTSNSVGASLFNASTNGAGWNPFSSSPSTKAPQTNPFSSSQTTNGPQQSSIFGAPSGLNSKFTVPSLFSNTVTSSSGKTTIFGATTHPSLPSDAPTINPFQNTQKPNPFSSVSSLLSRTADPQVQSEKDQPQNLSRQISIKFAVPRAGNSVNVAKNKLAIEIDALLQKNGIVAPAWPTLTPGDPRQKAAVETFWQSNKTYRAKVRTCLIRNGYLDDPDKPKKLSEAIDFKGTCEDMCPEFEKISRIVEHDVQTAEKEPSPDGQSYWPALHKMVKALTRSAAGQDAPLPEDVRSPAALRRTLDYLIDSVLGSNDLPTVHGFLWDRTRAIRRDFVFQQSSMTSQEMLDQVYCLEQIARFHVVALHQMSHENVVSEDFSEQQEVEQLGKTLLSLIHAYEDCMAQGIDCENEPEFRAYYIIFNSHNTGILEAIQDWGWKYWGESDDIRTATSLAETLQNIWDTHGPLRPLSATDIALNAYYRFFSITKETKVSYTMACFAEIHLNKVRKAAFKTILASYRKQRDQTTDWTLEKLNMYLHFDDEKDVVTFGEAFGLHFEDFNGQVCLSLDSDDSMTDPSPQLKQSHSYNLVERKRGNRTLPEVIHHTVYEEVAKEDDGNSFFVPSPVTHVLSSKSTLSRSPVTDTSHDPFDDPLVDDTPFTETDTGKPLTQGEQTITQSTKSQDPAQTRPVLPSDQEPIASTKDGKSANLAVFNQKSSGPDVTVHAGTTPIPEDKSFVPQNGIFFFSDQKNNSPSGPLPIPSPGTSGKPPFFPPITATQTPEASKTSLPPISIPPFSALGPGGISSQVVPPKLKSVVSTEQSVSHSEAPKAPADKHVDSSGINANHGKTRKSLDHPRSNHLARLDKTPLTASEPPKSRMKVFAEWVALGQGGLIDQYTESIVEKVLMQTVKKYVADEKKRRLLEEEKLSHEEAARFRYKFIATKYFYTWREIAHRLWMRRKGRLARQARRQMAEESLRASLAAKKDVVKEFKASQSAGQQGVERSLVLMENGSSPDEVAKHIPKEPKQGSRMANGESERLPRHKQSSSDSVLRKSLLSDSAYLQGGSRIHLIPNYSPTMEGRRQPNGVKTDYFRLKARGIMTLPDGTPLANTAAVHLRHKRSLDDVSKPMTPTRLISKPLANSVPLRPAANEIVPSETNTEREDQFEELKSRARAVMTNDKEGKQNSRKRYFDDDELELFANAKRVRDQMDEETEWLRAEIRKTLSRSSS